MLELKEWAEERDNARLERAKEEIDEKLPEHKPGKLHRKQPKIEYNNRKLRELRINELYNLRYREEKEPYLRNLEANKALYDLIN